MRCRLTRRQEWKRHLRSAIHPSLFAASYIAADGLSNVLGVGVSTRAQLLLAAPKVLQAVIAALGDYYTWKLAERIYGIRSLAPAATLVLTVASPWQWFCSTRTFSNSLETTLTVFALYHWPWHWSIPASGKTAAALDSKGLRVRNGSTSGSKGSETRHLMCVMTAAALATVLRPTNILIWAALVVLTLVRGLKTSGESTTSGSREGPREAVGPSGHMLSDSEWLALIREAVFCGTAVLALSAFVDRLFYQAWVFPPWNFLYVNVVQSIAVFYGNNNWHYYLTQGYPLLLTTALPFAATGIYRACHRQQAYRNLSDWARKAVSNLAIISLFVPLILSLISHKEVRFIYPLLPGLHVLASHPLATYFAPAFDSIRPYSRRPQLLKRALLGILLVLNLAVSLYTATVHNSGLVSITHSLRDIFETQYLPSAEPKNMTIGFLMPCHSTPWRSHLQHPPTSTDPGIDAWALTCEPPLDLEPSEKANYLDEADQFYASPPDWLKRHMSRNPPSPKFPEVARGTQETGVFANAKPRRVFEVEKREEEELWRERRGRRPWPEYLVFFGQLEPEMRRTVGARSGYGECERIWNSHAHDDWRRVGDIVVWCLYPGKGGKWL
jgi:GPI mannosyltransferase 3